MLTATLCGADAGAYLGGGGGGGGFGCSNTPLRVQVINYSLPNLTYGRRPAKANKR